MQSPSHSHPTHPIYNPIPTPCPFSSYPRPPVFYGIPQGFPNHNHPPLQGELSGDISWEDDSAGQLLEGCAGPQTRVCSSASQSTSPWPCSCCCFTVQEACRAICRGMHSPVFPRATSQLLPSGDRWTNADFGHETVRTALGHALLAHMSKFKSRATKPSVNLTQHPGNSQLYLSTLCQETCCRGHVAGSASRSWHLAEHGSTNLAEQGLCCSGFHSTGLSEPCCRGSVGMGQLAEEPRLPPVCHTGHSTLLSCSEGHAGHPDHWPKHSVTQQPDVVADVQPSFSIT